MSASPEETSDRRDNVQNVGNPISTKPTVDLTDQRINMDSLRLMLDHVTRLQDNDSNLAGSAGQLLRSCVEDMWRRPDGSLVDRRGLELDSLVTDKEILSMPLDTEEKIMCPRSVCGVRWKCDLIGRGGPAFDSALCLLRAAAREARRIDNDDEYIFQMEARLLYERERHWLVARFLDAAVVTVPRPRVRPLVQVFPRARVDFGSSSDANEKHDKENVENSYEQTANTSVPRLEAVARIGPPVIGLVPVHNKVRTATETEQKKRSKVVAISASDAAIYSVHADSSLSTVVGSVARSMCAVTASADGSRVVACLQGGLFVVWDMQVRSVASTFLLPEHESRRVRDMALSVDGKTFTLLGEGTEGVIVEIWDVSESGASAHRISSAVLTCEASELSVMLLLCGGVGGQHGIATGDKLGIIGIADVTTGEYAINLTHIGFSPVLAASAPNVHATTSATPTGTRVAWAGRRRIAVTEVCGTNIVTRRQLRFDSTAIALSDDGGVLAAAGRDGMVRVWDIVEEGSRAVCGAEQGRPPRIVSCGNGPSLLMGCAGLAIVDGLGGGRRGVVVAVGMDGTPRIYKNGPIIGDETAVSMPRARHGAAVYCVALTRNASVVVSGGADGSLMAWPVRAAGEKRDGECGGGVLDIIEGAHEGAVNHVIPWGFDFVSTYGATDGTTATWVVRPDGIKLVQRVPTQGRKLKKRDDRMWGLIVTDRVENKQTRGPRKASENVVPISVRSDVTDRGQVVLSESGGVSEQEGQATSNGSTGSGADRVHIANEDGDGDDGGATGIVVRKEEAQVDGEGATSNVTHNVLSPSSVMSGSTYGHSGALVPVTGTPAEKSSAGDEGTEELCSSSDKEGVAYSYELDDVQTQHLAEQRRVKVMGRVGCDGIHVIDRKSGRVLATLPERVGRASAWWVSDDGTLLVAGLTDGQVVWFSIEN